MKTVYLSGGHRSGWQKRIIEKVHGFHFKDPSSHDFKDPKLYTTWDLEAIRESDILFAYFESSNPSGYGLTLEVGYAAALDKQIIFVDEKSKYSPDTGKYLHLAREVSDKVFESIDDGLKFLESLR